MPSVAVGKYQTSLWFRGAFLSHRSMSSRFFSVYVSKILKLDICHIVCPSLLCVTYYNITTVKSLAQLSKLHSMFQYYELLFAFDSRSSNR
jgi:hypothetical protein